MESTISFSDWTVQAGENSTSFSNWTSQETEGAVARQEILPNWFNTFYFVCRLVQGFISFFSNLATIIVTLKFPELQNSCTNFFIASLALADALSGLVIFYQVITVYILDPITQSWRTACYFQQFLGLVSLTANMYGMFAITIDRYIYIQKPLQYYIIVTPKRSLAAIGSMWVLVILEIFFIYLFGSELPKGVPCRWILTINNNLFYFLTLQMYLLAILICLFYGMIGILIVKLKKNVHQSK